MIFHMFWFMFVYLGLGLYFNKIYFVTARKLQFSKEKLFANARLRQRLWGIFISGNSFFVCLLLLFWWKGTVHSSYLQKMFIQFAISQEYCKQYNRKKINKVPETFKVIHIAIEKSMHFPQSLRL